MTGRTAPGTQGFWSQLLVWKQASEAVHAGLAEQAALRSVVALLRLLRIQALLALTRRIRARAEAPPAGLRTNAGRHADAGRPRVVRDLVAGRIVGVAALAARVVRGGRRAVLLHRRRRRGIGRGDRGIRIDDRSAVGGGGRVDGRRGGGGGSSSRGRRDVRAAGGRRGGAGIASGLIVLREAGRGRLARASSVGEEDAGHDDDGQECIAGRSHDRPRVAGAWLRRLSMQTARCRPRRSAAATAQRMPENMADRERVPG